MCVIVHVGCGVDLRGCGVSGRECRVASRGCGVGWGVDGDYD